MERATTAPVTSRRLVDLRDAIRARWTSDLFVAAYARLSRHGADSMAAGLAFGFLLSVAPLLFVVLAIVSVVVGEGTAHDEAMHLVRDGLGARAEPLVAEWIDQARAWSTTATVLGVVLFAFGAGRFVALVDAAFDAIFEVEHAKTSSAWLAVRGYLSTQLLALGVTLVTALLLVASLLVRIAVPALVEGLDDGPLGSLWTIARGLVSFALLFVSIAILYRVLPPRRLDRGDLLEGAFVTTIGLEAALFVLRQIARHVDFGAAYGAAGAIVATLIVLYVAAQLFLFGAELTAELAARRAASLRP